MNVLRSIAAVVVGVIVQMVVISLVHQISGMIYPLPEGIDPNDMEALKRAMPAMPVGAFAMVLLAWESGAFFGGGAAALIAARARSVHAGIIGGFVLVATIVMLYLLPHPDWMIVLGLLLPLPLSILAGKLVDLLLPLPTLPALAEAPARPVGPQDVIKEGEPPFRPS